MIKGYTYINLSLFPVYVNDSHSSTQSLLLTPNRIGVQRYNSSKWMSYTNNQDLDNLHKLVKLSSDEGYEEDPSSNYYSNFQLITDLFDVILTKESDFRNKKIHGDIVYMLRKKEISVDLTTDNRYTAEFSKFHPQNNAIVLIANPTSNLSKQLINKRQRLNEYL